MGVSVGPDHTDPDGYRPEQDGLCHVCENARRELEAEREARAGTERTEIMARVRTRAADR